jgi:hypothetical protein
MQEMASYFSSLYNSRLKQFSCKTIWSQSLIISDEPLNETGYSKWSSVEPSAALENCRMVNPQGEFGDANCNMPMAFFCEQVL